MRCLVSVSFLVFVVLLAGCASRRYDTAVTEPPQQQVQKEETTPVAEVQVEEPDRSGWPELTLTALNDTKLSHVRDAFIERGWDPTRIHSVIGGADSKVKVEVQGHGYMYIPTSDRVLRRGLCNIQKAAVQGVVDYVREM